MFRLKQNKQITNRNSFIESIVWYFSENLGLFRFVSKQFCLFQLFQYRFKGSKTNRKFWFLVSRNKPKQNRNRSWFGLFQVTSKQHQCHLQPLFHNISPLFVTSKQHQWHSQPFFILCFFLYIPPTSLHYYCRLPLWQSAFCYRNVISKQNFSR